MSKKIKFTSVETQYDLPSPKPASRYIPEWFRKLDGVTKGIETIKKCIPFLDSMTTGYMIVTSADVYFDGVEFEEVTKENQITRHHVEQLGTLELPPEYLNKPFKWTSFFAIKTPRGYSTLFVHPLNRIDIPFYSLSGVVDTDVFPVPVNFPFYMKKDFRGVIPKGTPIVQAIPFKRTNWTSEVNDTDRAIPPLEFFNHPNPPFNFYKRKYWFKKTYR